MPRAQTTADLFDAPPLPPGLEYHADFLASGEEAALVELFAALPFREALFREYTARRRIVRFGFHYEADEHAWREIAPLPPLLAALRRKVAAFRGVPEHDYLHVLVTEYRPGTPIGWHRDRPQYGRVAGISFASDCRMRFRPYDNQHDRSAVVALDLAPRSLYVMEGDVRWRWQHSIPPTKGLRYSVTFRTKEADPRFAGHGARAP